MSLISFSPIQDGATGVNAAATNTPLSTIYNDYNGNITDANISASAAIAGSKIAVSSLGFSATLQSQANAGTAGGTMKYINLGGIKMLWCLSSNQTTGTGPISYTFTLPTSFFSTITMVQASAANPTGNANQYTTVTSQNTTTVTVYITSPGGAATAGIELFVIGT